MNEKWLTGRHLRIHGTFTKEAATKFNNTDQHSESFTYQGPYARNPPVPSEEPKDRRITEQKLLEKIRKGKAICVESKDEF